MKKILIGTGMVIVLVVVVVLSVRPQKKPGVEVYAASVTRGALSATVRATGVVAPALRVNVSAEISSRIDELLVVEGQRVEKGDLLVRLDADPFRTEVEGLEASLRMAEIAVREREVALRDALATLNRRKALLEEGLISTEEHERAEIAAESAEVRLQQAREQVDQARATVEKARDALEKTDLRSPIAGLVTEVRAQQGESVVAGIMNNPGTVILVVSDMSRVVAELRVDEHDVASIQVGQPAEIDVDALDDTTLVGEVSEIAQTAQSSQGQNVPTFVVKVDMEVDPRLRPGMTARGTIETASRAEALSVPIQSVLSDDADEKDESWVFVVEADKAVRRVVVPGISNERMVEIESGLEGGEQVVTGPYRRLKDLDDGDVVRAEEEDGDAKDEKGEADDENGGDEAEAEGADSSESLDGAP